MYFSSKGKIKKNKYVAAAQYFLGSLKGKSFGFNWSKICCLVQWQSNKRKRSSFFSHMQKVMQHPYWLQQRMEFPKWLRKPLNVIPWPCMILMRKRRTLCYCQWSISNLMYMSFYFHSRRTILLKKSIFYEVNDEGNSALHFAAMKAEFD